jgi:hypothetical protein
MNFGRMGASFGRMGALGDQGGDAYILDRLSVSSAAAYSLRKLRSAYTGSAIRVRRSSDNTEADIGFTAAGDLDTVALLAHVGAGSGFVTTWYDQSGNARNAAQVTASSQPRIVNAGVVEMDGGTVPAMSFDGGDVLGTTLSPDRTAFPELTVTTVYRTTDLTTFKALWGADNGGFDRGQLLGSAGNNWGFLTGNTSVSQAAILNTLSPIVYTATMRVNVPGGSAVAANGVVNAPVTEALGSAHGTLGIGALNGGGQFAMFGFIREFIVFPSALSTADRQTLEQNQGDFYGITIA